MVKQFQVAHLDNTISRERREKPFHFACRTSSRLIIVYKCPEINPMLNLGPITSKSNTSDNTSVILLQIGSDL